MFQVHHPGGSKAERGGFGHYNLVQGLVSLRAHVRFYIGGLWVYRVWKRDFVEPMLAYIAYS